LLGVGVAVVIVVVIVLVVKGEEQAAIQAEGARKRKAYKEKKDMEVKQ